MGQGDSARDFALIESMKNVGTGCISHFSYCTIGVKDLPKPAAPIMRCCPKVYPAIPKNRRVSLRCSVAAGKAEADGDGIIHLRHLLLVQMAHVLPQAALIDGTNLLQKDDGILA